MPFQADYVAQWHWLVEGIARRRLHRSDVRIALEYKSKESRKHCTLGDAGRALHLCHQVELDNVGVTFDVGHALIAGEWPAAGVCAHRGCRQALYTHFQRQRHRLGLGHDPRLGVRLGSAGDPVLPATHRLVGLAQLRRVTRSADDVVGVQVATMRVMQAAEKLLKKIGREQLDAMIARGAAP